MRVVVAGGAGMIGSHLCEALVARGDDVVAVDNLCTGRLRNLDALDGHPSFRFVQADAATWLPVDGPIDAVCHLASPASPADFARRPVEILHAGSTATFSAVELALDHGARLLFASTSEVYGDPVVHPQVETYRGNVSTLGPRACYDESKRFGEAVISTHARHHGLDARIARIFNTYGPRLRPDDGRVVSNFVVQALADRPITLHGDGHQTRSFCFVDDLVRGLVALLDSDEPRPVNLGNPSEVRVREVAELVVELTGSRSELVQLPLPIDDPVRRRPDVERARASLGWEPRVALRDGLLRTIEGLRVELALSDAAPAHSSPDEDRCRAADSEPERSSTRVGTS